MMIDEAIPSVCVPEGQSGIWRVERFTIEKREADIANLRYAMGGSRRHCRPGNYTRLMRGNTLVMSDTPDEKRDHYSFVRAATGNVLINGLGLGMVLNAVLCKADISSVTVVERSTEVISLVASCYTDHRVTIIEADAMAYKPQAGAQFDAVWHDIWDSICSDNLEEMKSLHRRYGRKTKWQGSWARELCEMQRERWAS